MRELWSGEYVSHHGQHYSVENARIYTRTEQPPPVYVSGLGPKSAELAGRIGDGFVTTQPDRELLQRFRDSGGEGKAGAGRLQGLLEQRRGDRGRDRPPVMVDLRASR